MSNSIFQWIWGLVLGFLPGMIWLFFFLREDNAQKPTPRSMIAKVYFAGILSALMALLVEILLHDFLSGVTITIPRIIEDNVSVFLGFAVIEEIIKFVFVYFVVRKSKFFDEPIDAMIYLITGALGFATAENFFLVFSSQTAQEAFSIILLRFIGATLLHALTAAILGHHWARGIRFRIEGRLVVEGLVLATLAHTLFNYLIFKFNDYLVYPTVFLLTLGFFVLYDFEELKKMEETDERLINAPQKAQ